MGRKTRNFLPNLPYHIIKRSLTGLEVFSNKSDCKVFVELMSEYSTKFNIKVYSYVLMDQYFEFIISAENEENIPRFMQILSKLYANYYNKTYNRKGTIWEGRYKNSILEPEKYMQKAITYLNSLSLRNNLNHTIRSSYKSQEKVLIDKTDESFIIKCLVSENITGSENFITLIGNKLGQELMPKKRGRPKNNEFKGKRMYKKLELLSKEKHKSFKIKPLNDLSFTKSDVTVPLVLSEIEKVSPIFPIVFTGDENPNIVALISLGKENLAVNNEGKWITNYLPAEYRKYPFTYVSVKENNQQKAVAIDIEADNISEDEGLELFLESGEQSQVLKDTIQFLTNYEQESMMTKSLAKTISDANILEEREISIGEGEEKQVLVKGFKVIDREKLNSLSDDVLASWVRRGIINFIEMHLKSLNNMELLMNLSNKQ